MKRCESQITETEIRWAVSALHQPSFLLYDIATMDKRIPDIDVNGDVETTDHLIGLALHVDRSTISEDGQSFWLQFHGSGKVPWHHHYQTVMGGRYKGHTLQQIPSTYLHWSIRKQLEKAVSMAAELKRRELVKRLTK